MQDLSASVKAKDEEIRALRSQVELHRSSSLPGIRESTGAAADRVFVKRRVRLSDRFAASGSLDPARTHASLSHSAATSSMPALR
jgi:hypothetical protein